MKLGLLPLVVRRILTYAPLLLPVLLGTTVASATTASIVIYTQSLRDLGLEHAIQNADPRSLDLEASFQTPGLDPETYEETTGRVHSAINRRLSGLVEQDVVLVRSATFLVTESGVLETDLDTTPRAAFHYVDDAEKLLAVTGRMPESGAVSTSDGVVTVEAVALKQGADFRWVVSRATLFHSCRTGMTARMS